MAGPKRHQMTRRHRAVDDAGVDITDGFLAGALSGDVVWIDPATIIPTGDFLLKNEGGQDFINPDPATLGAAKTWDPTLGNVHTGTLDQDCTFTISAPVGSGASTLAFWITQDGTGGWDITWPGSVTWDGGTPTPDTTAGVTVRYILESLDGGTNWIGNMVGGGSALTVEDDGTPLATDATSLDFVGAGVTATGAGAAKTITIPGGATASDTGIWRPLMDGAGNVITDGATGEAVMAFS